MPDETAPLSFEFSNGYAALPAPLSMTEVTWPTWAPNAATATTLYAVPNTSNTPRYTVATVPNAALWNPIVAGAGTDQTVWNWWQGVIIPPFQPPFQPEEALREAEVVGARLQRQARSDARRARALLRQHLTPRQRRELAQHRTITLVAPSGRRYRIAFGSVQNVYELDADDVPIRRFCIHPGRDVPTEDAMLAQKLTLEADEEAFEQIANVITLDAARLRRQRQREAAHAESA